MKTTFWGGELLVFYINEWVLFVLIYGGQMLGKYRWIMWLSLDFDGERNVCRAKAEKMKIVGWKWVILGKVKMTGSICANLG